MFLDFKTRLIGMKKAFHYRYKLLLYSQGQRKDITMSDYRARYKAKRLADSFRFTPSISRSHVGSARIAEARLRKAAYDLDPDTYGGHCGFVTTHSGRAIKTMTSRANNSRAHSVPESRALPPIPAKPYREYWACSPVLGRYAYEVPPMV